MLDQIELYSQSDLGAMLGVPARRLVFLEEISQRNVSLFVATIVALSVI